MREVRYGRSFLPLVLLTASALLLGCGRRQYPSTEAEVSLIVGDAQAEAERAVVIMPRCISGTSYFGYVTTERMTGRVYQQFIPTTPAYTRDGKIQTC